MIIHAFTETNPPRGVSLVAYDADGAIFEAEVFIDSETGKRMLTRVHCAPGQVVYYPIQHAIDAGWRFVRKKDLTGIFDVPVKDDQVNVTTLVTPGLACAHRPGETFVTRTNFYPEEVKKIQLPAAVVEAIMANTARRVMDAIGIDLPGAEREAFKKKVLAVHPKAWCGRASFPPAPNEVFYVFSDKRADTVVGEGDGVLSAWRDAAERIKKAGIDDGKV